LYEHNGEKYYVVDAHMHYWNAAPDNWVPGAEQYAKGWIECFHAYQGLGPPDTHWSIEHFQKYSEDDLMKDVFQDGYVDVAIFQPTYLKEWYKEGFNTTERNALMGERHPGKFIHNTRFDPRDSDAGLEELRRNVDRFGSKGAKLYTAEWNNGSRGYKLSDPGAYRYLEAAQNLGIKNIHVHKGPTIWPLDKDAFDVSDIDHCATDFPELNFIIEHVGLPRIEDFCFMATQEPNVYAGLAVVIGGLMHARPNFFAKVMGELLFWVGEDKMLFGSDYAIWEPKWQVEGFVNWEMPDREEFADYPRLGVAGKKKIMGLNAANLYDIKVPDELQLPPEAGGTHPPRPPLGGTHPPGPPLRREDMLRALETVRDPELDEPITSLGFVASCAVSAAGDAQVRLRLPTYFCAPNFAYLMVADAYDAVSALPGVRHAEVILEDHFASDVINGGVAAQAGFVRSFDGEAVSELHALRADFLRKAVMAGTDQVCRPLLAAGKDPAALLAMTLGEVPPSRALDRLRSRRSELGLPAGDDAPLLIEPLTGAPVTETALPLHLRKAKVTRISIEANSGICRGMLRHRYNNTQGQGETVPSADSDS